jgi:hypothetical protein
MNNQLKFLITLILSCTVFACTEDFKVGAPYKNVSIVYGILSQSDTAHYIKITRGYFDENKNNLEMAKIIDSLYHKDLTVQILEKTNSGSVINTYNCTKVDLKQEGISKDSGAFVNSPNYAYKFKATLNKDYTYELKIKDNSSGETITGVTSIISNKEKDFYTPQFTTQGGNVKLDFSKQQGIQQFICTMPAGASIVDVYLKFTYYEQNNVLGTGYDKIAYLPIAQSVEGKPGDPINISFNSSSLAGLLNAGIGVNKNGIERKIDTGGVVFLAGGTDLKRYIDASRAQGGITADEIQPVFTNLSGNNVYGLYSSRASRTIDGVLYTPETFDSLLNSSVYRPLNFTGISDH